MSFLPNRLIEAVPLRARVRTHTQYVDRIHLFVCMLFCVACMLMWLGVRWGRV